AQRLPELHQRALELPHLIADAPRRQTVGALPLLHATLVVQEKRLSQIAEVAAARTGRHSRNAQGALRRAALFRHQSDPWRRARTPIARDRSRKARVRCLSADVSFSQKSSTPM